MVKILCLALLFVLAVLHDGSAQSGRRPIAACYTGLGVYSVYQQDVFSFSANQAALARINRPTAGMYGEKRFLLEELGFYQLSFAIPTRSGNFGVETDYFGFSDYHETSAGLAYARKLGEKIDIGAQFNYYNIHIAGYGQVSAVNTEIGMAVRLTDKFRAGIHAFNPFGGKFNKGENEKLVSVYTFGIGYDASEIFFFGAEIGKEENQAVNVNAGILYKFLSKLAARAGIATSTSSFYMGIGIYLDSFRFDVVSTYQRPLGITPGIMIQYEFSSSKE